MSSVTARATTTADSASSPGRESTTVTRQDADSRLRPPRPYSAVPAATCASVRASVLPGTTQAASSAAGSAAVTAAVRASRYAVAAASGPAAASPAAACPPACRCTGGRRRRGRERGRHHGGRHDVRPVPSFHTDPFLEGYGLVATAVISHPPTALPTLPRVKNRTARPSGSGRPRPACTRTRALSTSVRVSGAA